MVWQGLVVKVRTDETKVCCSWEHFPSKTEGLVYHVNGMARPTRAGKNWWNNGMLFIWILSTEYRGNWLQGEWYGWAKTWRLELMKLSNIFHVDSFHWIQNERATIWMIWLGLAVKFSTRATNECCSLQLFLSNMDPVYYNLNGMAWFSCEG